MKERPRVPDPGGVFDSDLHRRVAAHVPVATEDAQDLERLYERLVDDLSTTLGIYKNPADNQLVDKGDEREKLRTVLDELIKDGDVAELKAGTFHLTKEGFEALNGSNGFEPAPLEGEELAEALRKDKMLEEKYEAYEKARAAERVKELEAELAEAKRTAKGEKA